MQRTVALSHCQTDTTLSTDFLRFPMPMSAGGLEQGILEQCPVHKSQGSFLGTEFDLATVDVPFSFGKEDVKHPIVLAKHRTAKTLHFICPCCAALCCCRSRKSNANLTPEVHVHLPGCTCNIIKWYDRQETAGIKFKSAGHAKSEVSIIASVILLFLTRRFLPFARMRLLSLTSTKVGLPQPR